ncbi:hypothetical protein Droror1_Dr00012951 [Drosera rotundifolia]
MIDSKTDGLTAGVVTPGYRTPVTCKVAPNGNHIPYPPPLARYEEVIINPRLFMETLEKLHATMGTKFMIPIIGGRDLDLHKLFVEVTTRGGIEKIMNDKRWKDVTATFNFPSTATNASFVLRKYYYSLLQHYEQIYFFKAQGWTHLPPGSLQSPPLVQVAAHGLPTTPQQIQTTTIQPFRANITEISPGVAVPPSQAAAAAAPLLPSSVVGVIDGKIDSGYLVTVKVGNEMLKGVIYHPSPPAQQATAHDPSIITNQITNIPPATIGVKRRRHRRKKSEIRRRDPAHPKPNRSGYNFFFAEQHARLKPLHSGKDRMISRMIGELWNNLNENDRTVYQEKALKDKERYRIEMEDYKKTRASTSQGISAAVPLQQRVPDMDVDMVEVNVKEGADVDSVGTPEDEDESDCSMSDAEDDGTGDSNVETTENTETGKNNDKGGDDSDESLGQKNSAIAGETKEVLEHVADPLDTSSGAT